MSDDRHACTQLRAAAWVPNDDPARPWADAVALAAEWIWTRSDVEQSAPMLVSNTRNASHLGYAHLKEIVHAGGHTTPQGAIRNEHGPVLAFVPDERALRTAMDLARGHSLAVVEGSVLSMHEWAANAEVVNLVTGQATSSAVPDDVRRDLDFIILDSGRSGWTGPEEKAQAQRYLADHIRAGRLTPDQAAAYVLASPSVTYTGAKRLRALLGDSGDSSARAH